MRKVLVALGTGVVVLAFASAAYASTDVAGIQTTFSTTKGNSKLSSLSVTLTTDYLPPGTPPNTLVPDPPYHGDVTVPIAYSSKGYFSCSQSDVTTYESAKAQGQTPPKACNKAQVGTGTAIAYGVACNTHPPRNGASVQQISLALELFNSGNGLIAYLKATSPSSASGIQGAFAVTIAKVATGATLSFDLPQPLVEAIPGLCSPITQTVLTINTSPATTGKKGKKASTAKKKKKKKKKVKPFLSTAACPSNKTWTSSNHELYSNGKLDSNGNLVRSPTDESTATVNTTCT